MPSDTNAVSANPSGRYYIFLLCYLAALGAFASFVNDLYLPTLPQMRREFHATPSEIQLGLSFVMLGLGFGELFWGPLSDRIGRKAVLYLSLALFIAASIASIFSPTIWFFLWCRLFQGLGAAGEIMLSRAVPADLYTGKTLGKIMAVVGAINGIAPVSGPLFGGMLANSIGWRGIFGLLAAIGLVILFCGIPLRETLPKAKRRVTTISQVFASYLQLLKNRKFMTHVILKSAALGVLFCYISAGPFIIQEHYGFTPFQFGLFFGGNAMAIVLGSVLSIHFKTMKKAAITGAFGMVAFAFAEVFAIWDGGSIWLFESLIVPMLFFSGIVFAAGNTLAMSEGGDAGEASAILGLGGYIFGCVVSPLVGLGNIIQSTCIGLVVCALIALYYAYRSYKLPAMKIQP